MVRKKNSRLSDQEKIDIVAKFKTGLFSYNDLATIYQVTASSIRSVLKIRGQSKVLKYKI